jgi:hypothetical protein
VEEEVEVEEEVYAYVVPPALGKVGELVLERHLPDLEHDRQEQAQVGIAQQQRLREPPHHVRQHELVVHRVLRSVI